MKKGFGALLIRSFSGALGLILGGLTIVFGFVAWRLKPDEPIPLWVFILANYLWGIFLALFWTAYNEAQTILAESWTVVSVKKPEEPFLKCHLIIIAKPPVRADRGTSVYVVRVDEGDERHIGIGTVVWAQENECVQITLDKPFAADDPYIQELRNRDLSAIKKLRVRPHHMSVTGPKEQVNKLLGVALGEVVFPLPLGAEEEGEDEP